MDKFNKILTRAQDIKIHETIKQVHITSAKTFRSESVIMHAISMIWSLSISNPVIWKINYVSVQNVDENGFAYSTVLIQNNVGK